MSDVSIIIFEDNEDLRESLRMLVSGSPGLSVEASYSNCSMVQEAIEIHAPQVVLMDIDMPEVNGIEGLRIIKSISPQTRVIMLTVFDQNEHVFEALRSGADGYLLKRSSPDQIIAAVEDVITGGAPMTPAIARMVLAFFSKKPSLGVDSGLTPKEIDVLKLLVDGYSYKMISAELDISIDTVRSHIKSIYRKLHVNSKSEAVVKAIREKLV